MTNINMGLKCASALLFSATALAFAAEPDRELRYKATLALERAVKFFREHVAVEGTYVWQYSEDLSKREGEGKVTSTQGWVQPPGTPSVGIAFLAAWQATSNCYFLDAARETAQGLAKGQMRSGGWHYSIEFEPKARGKFDYRIDNQKKRTRNVTTFDDDTTQATVRFLVRMEAALGFSDSKLQEVIEYAINAILKAQYPNGAWPQGYEEFPEPEKFPVKKASYPAEWPRQWPGSGQYWLRYTLNDNAMATMIDTLIEIDRLYGKAPETKRRDLGKRAASAMRNAGDFLLLSQMPAPQPAWAQQYDFDMHPTWARKFEPPSVSGGESQGVLRTLLKVYRYTGDAKYLKPLPGALAYLRKSRLPDGRLARFYELRSNKPLYFTKNYEITYDDADMPTHYSFKLRDDTDEIAREYDALRDGASLQSAASDKPILTDRLRADVRGIIASQDVRGRWVEEGRLRHHGPDDPTSRAIRSATFIRNIETLSHYLEATRP